MTYRKTQKVRKSNKRTHKVRISNKRRTRKVRKSAKRRTRKVRKSAKRSTNNRRQRGGNIFVAALLGFLGTKLLMERSKNRG